MRNLVCKFLYRFFFHLIHFLFIGFTTLLQDMLDLGQCYYRKELREKEVAGEEKTKGAHVKSNLPDGRCIVYAPGRRNIIPVQRRNDNHKTLEPHADVHNNRHEESDVDVPAHLAEPE